MKEPLAEVVVKGKNIGAEREEYSGVVFLRPDLTIFYDLDLHARPITVLTDRAVDGVGHEFPKSKGYFAPIFFPVSKDKSQIFCAGAVGPRDGIGATILDDDTAKLLG